MAATTAGHAADFLDDLNVEERLDDLPRHGAPPRLTANFASRIIQAHKFSA